MQEPLPAELGLEAALCTSLACLIRMVNNDFCPILILLSPKTADISGSLSLSCPPFVLLVHTVSVSGRNLVVDFLNERPEPQILLSSPRGHPLMTFILLETDGCMTYIPVTVSSA